MGVDPSFNNLSGGQIILIHGQVVGRWGEKSRLASVAVVFSGKDGPADIAIHEFAQALGINLTALIDGQRYLINTVGVRTFAGRRDVWIPLLIAALIVL